MSRNVVLEEDVIVEKEEKERDKKSNISNNNINTLKQRSL